MEKHRIIYEAGMVALALFAVVLTILDITGSFVLKENAWAYYTDICILLIFAADYIIRFAIAKKKLTFAKENIFELIAIIPFSSLFRAFRMLRLVKLSKAFKIFKITRCIEYIKGKK